jgi:hypothetical protein
MSLLEKAQKYVENIKKMGGSRKRLDLGENLGDVISLNGKRYVRIFDGITERFVKEHSKEHIRWISKNSYEIKDF